MHEDYVDRPSVKDTELYYLEDNTYDEYNESIFDSFYINADDLKAH